MGATLIIESVWNKAYYENIEAYDAAASARNANTDPDKTEQLLAQVERLWELTFNQWTFRDKWGQWSIFEKLGLPLSVYVAQNCDHNGVLSLEGATALKEQVESRLIPAKTKDRAYFVAKREQLLAFLQTALDMREPILCSI